MQLGTPFASGPMKSIISPNKTLPLKMSMNNATVYHLYVKVSNLKNTNFKVYIMYTVYEDFICVCTLYTVF